MLGLGLLALGLRVVRFYQAYSTLVVCYHYVTVGI